MADGQDGVVRDKTSVTFHNFEHGGKMRAGPPLLETAFMELSIADEQDLITLHVLLTEKETARLIRELNIVIIKLKAKVSFLGSLCPLGNG